VEALVVLRCDHDQVLIDAPGGIGDNVVQVVRDADRPLVVVSPEPTSLVDAYATIKVLSRDIEPDRLGLIVNAARDDAEMRAVHEQLDRVCRRFLGTGISLVGAIPFDEHVAEAVREQRAVVELFPTCAASRSFERLAARLRGTVANDEPPLWSRLPEAPEGAVH
jgi:flagellar biosynthesis protein FlhG